MAPPSPPKMTLEDLLVRHGAITPAQLEQARAEQKKWGDELGRTLVELRFISEPLLMKAYAHLYGLPMSQPDREAIPRDAISAVAVHICERFGIIPVAVDEQKKAVRVATSRPTDKTFLQDLAQLMGRRLEVAAASTDSIERAIRVHYYGEGAAASPGTPAPLPPGTATDATRLRSIEAGLEKLRAEVKRLGANDAGFVALMARVEALEQQLMTQADASRAVAMALVRRGVLPAEDLPPPWRPAPPPLPPKKTP